MLQSGLDSVCVPHAKAARVLRKPTGLAVARCTWLALAVDSSSWLWLPVVVLADPSWHEVAA